MPSGKPPPSLPADSPNNSQTKSNHHFHFGWQDWNFTPVFGLMKFSLRSPCGTILRKEYMVNILLWYKSKVLIDIIFILFAVEWMTGGEVSYGTNVFGSRLRGWS